MNGKSDLVKCKELIIYKFKIDDLKYCLHGLSCNISGKKDDLQRRLRTILETETTQHRAIDVIFARGISMGYITKPKSGNLVDTSNTKSSSKSSNRCASYETDICMKNLYFYKDIQSITGWKIIQPSDNSQSVFLNFNVPTDLEKFLISSNENEQPIKCFFLRCANVKQDVKSVPLNDCYPILMRMFINGQDFTSYLPREICYSSADKKNRLSVPTILNEPLTKIFQYHCKDRFAKIELRYDKDANKNETFAFSIFSSTTKTVKEICQEILSKKKVTFEKFDDDFKKFMKPSEDVALECAKIPLRSSITYETIKIPFRGKNCNHISPDDLEDYLMINKNTEAWLCKICKHPCTPDDIMVDEFFMNILKKHPTADGIVLYPGMNYKLYGGNDILSGSKSAIKAKKKNDDTSIVLIDSDDEFDDVPKNVNTTSLPSFKNEINVGKLNKVNDSNSKQVECIVIDDSSDEEPSQKRIRTSEVPCIENASTNNTNSFEGSTLGNEVNKYNTLNSNVDVNNQFSTNINPSNDFYVSDQFAEINNPSIYHNSKTFPNSTKNCPNNSIETTISKNNEETIEKLNKIVQNTSTVFDEFLIGIVDKNLYNIDKILDQQVKDGILPKNHLSINNLHKNNDLQNVVNIHSMVPFISEKSSIQQYLEERNDQFSNMKNFVNEIDSQSLH